MRLVLQQSFPLGRFHATQWKANPFDKELAGEWPPSPWRLVRAIVAEGPDDIFVAGDAHQRIYGHRARLKQVGVNVAGRSTYLRINYRTTAEILGWSFGILNNETFEKGVESLGEVDLGAPNTSFGPNKFDGQDEFQLFKIDPTWKEGSGKDQLIAIGSPITLK